MSDHEIAARRFAPIDRLRAEALAVAQLAYQPYSGLGVGAAALAVTPTASGDNAEPRIVVGCNVENSSYGLTLCAECSLVSDFHRTGGGRLIELVVVTRSGVLLPPCGRCRQLLLEHGGADLVVHLARGPVRLAELLPDAFGPEDLA